MSLSKGARRAKEFVAIARTIRDVRASTPETGQ